MIWHLIKSTQSMQCNSANIPESQRHTCATVWVMAWWVNKSLRKILISLLAYEMIPFISVNRIGPPNVKPASRGEADARFGSSSGECDCPHDPLLLQEKVLLPFDSLRVIITRDSEVIMCVCLCVCLFVTMCVTYLCKLSITYSWRHQWLHQVNKQVKSLKLP